MLAAADQELFSQLTPYIARLPKKVRKAWPEDKVASFALSTGATFSVDFSSLTGFNYKIEKYAAYINLVASTLLRFATALPNLIFSLIKDRRVEDFFLVLKYMKTPFIQPEKNTLILGRLTQRIKVGTDLAALFRETATDLGLRRLTAKRAFSWGRLL